MKSKEYYIYKNMLAACETATVNEDLAFDCSDERNEMLLFLASELAKLDIDNPVMPDEQGYNEYEDIKYFYNAWPKDKPNCAFKKRFMLAAYRLCKLRPDNIFERQQEEDPIIEISLEDIREREYEETEQEDISTGTYIPVSEQKRVFGVIPFNYEEEQDEPQKEKQNEEKQRSLFKRNKRRNKR